MDTVNPAWARLGGGHRHSTTNVICHNSNTNAIGRHVRVRVRARVRVRVRVRVSIGSPYTHTHTHAPKPPPPPLRSRLHPHTRTHTCEEGARGVLSHYCDRVGCVEAECEQEGVQVIAPLAPDAAWGKGRGGGGEGGGRGCGVWVSE